MPAAHRIVPADEGLLVVDLGAELSIYDGRSGEALFLNATAADVWRRLDGGTTIDDLVDALAGSYATEPDSIRRDVERVVAELQERRLLTAGPVA